MLTCSSCGGNFDDTFQFCPYCGRPRPEPQEVPITQKGIKVDVVSHAPSSPLDCPKCHRMDSVAKVSAIVQGGTHHINGQIPVSYTSHDSEGWHSGTSYESYHATQQSALASRLMPPEKPTKGFHGLVGIGCLPFLFAPCVFVGGAGGLVSPEVPLLGRLVFVLGLGLYVAFLIGLLFLHEHLDKPVQARHTANMRAWEYSLSRWREMYYCSRDDCLFVPGEGLSFNISDFNGAIKWNLGQKSNGFFPKLF